MTPQTPILREFHASFGHSNRQQIHAFYRKFIASGLVVNLSFTVRHISSSHNLPRMEELWQVRALRAGLAHLDSVYIDVADPRYQDRSRNLHLSRSYSSNGVDVAARIPWSDDTGSHNLDKLTIRLPTLPPTYVLPMATIAEEIIKHGGPLCEYEMVFRARPDRPCLPSISTTELLRREINRAISKTRAARPVCWHRKTRSRE